MNIIEQMYKEYGVGKVEQCNAECIPCDGCGMPCEECTFYNNDYPPFTAEKQIELIELLIKNDLMLTFRCEYIFVCSTKSGAHKGYGKTLSEQLIDLFCGDFINFIDNSKVKEILEK